MYKKKKLKQKGKNSSGVTSENSLITIDTRAIIKYSTKRQSGIKTEITLETVQIVEGKMRLGFVFI